MAASKYPYADKATRYARSVVRGKIPAGRYVRLACQRHLDDIEASKKKSFPYEWDRAAADRIGQFVGMMQHVKGKDWVGKPIVLEPWQCFLLCVPFGWLQRSDGKRRYREVYAQIPRKNAKSTTAAGVGLYMLCADGEPGSEVYSGATSEAQAFEVFRPAWQMADRNHDLQEYFGLGLMGSTNNPGSIYCLSDGSRFVPVIGKPGDGASPHCAIVDEYHEHKTDVLYDAMKTGMGARSQPMLFVITTAGTDTGVPCYAHRARCIRVLEGSITDDRLFVLIYEPDEDDNWQDLETWKKTNPNYGVSVYASFLQDRRMEALQSAERQNILRTKHLNQWMNAGAGWMNMAKWAACARPGMLPEYRQEDLGQAISDWLRLPREEVRGLRVWMGMDLASKIDNADLVALIEMPDRRSWATFAWHFLPEDTVDLPQNAHYQAWRDQGWLIATDGARTDFRAIMDHLQELSSVVSIQSLGFDPREASNFVQDVHKWASFECVEITQSPQQMSEPMKEVEALAADVKLIHPDDPVFNWQMGNVVVKTARGGGPVKYQFPTKDRAANKIDGPVALIMAMKMASMAGEPEEEGPLMEIWN